MHPLPSFLRAACIAVLLAVCTASSALGQTVRGRVTSRDSGQPIAGAVVHLLNSRGQTSSRALTDASGGFALTARSPGEFRLRVDRIGFLSEFSGAVQLRQGETTEYPLPLSSRSSTLEGLTVRGRSRGCSIRDNAETVTRVWEEARKALDVITLSQSNALVRFDTETFRRELDPETRAVLAEQRRAYFGRSENPFRSVPVEDLASMGYVRSFQDSTIYYAPDAAVLLSDGFLDTHCFRIASAPGGDDALIGLEFRPAQRLSRPDVAGTLWLDRKTSELRSAEYRYVGHAFADADDDLGGRLEFERVASSGAWIVRRWVIRMPVVTQKRMRFVHPLTSKPEERTEVIVTAVVEEGGEVVGTSAPGSPRSSVSRAAVAGVVVDSIAGEPLARAVVYLSGTSFSDTTDVDGHYRIEGVPEGRYVVSFTHPRLIDHGIIPSPGRAEVHPSSEAAVNLAVPSRISLLRRYCPALADNQAALIVAIKNRVTAEPVARAQVSVQWTTDTGVRGGSLGRTVTGSGEVRARAEDAWLRAEDMRMDAASDDSGVVRVCGLPLRSTVEVQARVGSAVGRRSIMIGSDRLAMEKVEIEVD